MENFSFLLIVTTLLFAFLVQQAAKIRGRSTKLWFVLGLLFGIFALIALYLMPAKAMNNEPQLKPVMQSSAFPPPENSDDQDAFIPQPQAQKSYWYFIDQEKKMNGPMSFDRFCTKYNQGKILTNSYVWTENMPDWQHLEKTDVFKKIQQNPPTNPS